MKIGTINVRSGGSARSVTRLLDFMTSIDCSTIVFSEFRDNSAGRQLIDRARAAGLEQFAYTSDLRGVLIVSRYHFEPSFNPGNLSTYTSAMVRADFRPLILYGVYLPTGARKFPHFDYLIQAAAMHNKREERVLAIGDFNAGQNELDIQINALSGKLLDDFPAHSRFLKLNAIWPEAWRRLHPNVLEYSWYASNKPISQKKGWRLDQAFISPALVPKLRRAEYHPEPRLQDLTDHSALSVELNMPEKEFANPHALASAWS